jgi:DNA-binding LytR/AlgR family response regulator
MRFPLTPLLVFGAGALVVALVNATSRLLEAERDGDPLAAWAPFVWEFSSFLAIMVLAPLIGEAVRRWSPRRDNLVRFASVHIALALAFSLAHSAAMVALRKLAYAAIGSFYDFSHGNLARELFYEGRKDVLTYFLVGLVYWFFQWRAAQAREPVAPTRIEIRDGATAVFLPPADILWVEAAGNYVQFHTSAKTHLVRGTLAAWEGKLGAAFPRVHRSRLVNRARIRALKPTPAGDVEITLDDGRAVLGSRRYRAAFEAERAV